MRRNSRHTRAHYAFPRSVKARGHVPCQASPQSSACVPRLYRLAVPLPSGAIRSRLPLTRDFLFRHGTGTLEFYSWHVYLLAVIFLRKPAKHHSSTTSFMRQRLMRLPRDTSKGACVLSQHVRKCSARSVVQRFVPDFGRLLLGPFRCEAIVERAVITRVIPGPGHAAGRLRGRRKLQRHR
jgi:hypothetical protein